VIIFFFFRELNLNKKNKIVEANRLLSAGRRARRTAQTAMNGNSLFCIDLALK
jgi:hypothetical protein